jgi:hypothetical protein
MRDRGVAGVRTVTPFYFGLIRSTGNSLQAVLTLLDDWFGLVMLGSGNGLIVMVSKLQQ